MRAERHDHWQIPADEGRFLHQLALSVRPRVIIEIGTSYGFSGLHWADVLHRTGGLLHTVDIDERKVRLSREIFAKAGVSHVVANYHGDGAAVIPTLPDAVDLAFIDADKPNTARYVELLWPKLRAGGSLLIDNATTHRKELAGVVGALRSRPDACSTEVAVGNGVEWAVKV